MVESPLLNESTLPFKLAPFADITEDHYVPSFEQGMADQLREVAAITSSAEPATFANTIEALERSGRLLDRVTVAFFSLAESRSTDSIAAIEADISPRLSMHHDEIHLDRALFERLSSVTTSDPEEAWLLERYLRDFVRAGAALGEPDQHRLRSINEELARHAITFTQNLVRAAEESAFVTSDAADLDGLPDSTLTTLERAGGYVLPLLNFTNQPALAMLTDRDARRRLLELSTRRAPENKAIAITMARLRALRARILGFSTHAAYAVADQTARTPQAVDELLGALVGPAVANVRREATALSQQAGFAIQPWDWAFYAERARQSQYDLDGSVLRPYFELWRVLHDGVFAAAGALYGLTFTPRRDLSGYHDDVAVYEVREEDSTPLGLFLIDPYARRGKRGGAWMNSLVRQSHLFDERPVVTNNLNITKPASGPTLLTLDEVTTAFHEFGHALHGLLSDVRFPRLSGTAVPRDFVEYPSQVNEMWAMWPSVLAGYARHHETGEPVPVDLLAKLTAAERFNQGFQTVEFLCATLLDWAWHTIGPDDDIDDAEAFETAALTSAGIAFDLVPPRYRTSYFAHAFSDGVGGYSAGYYSYVWSEVLDADSVDWFRENGGLTRANGDHFRSTLLSKGGSTDVLAAFWAFRGREARIEPLLRRRGFVISTDR